MSLAPTSLRAVLICVSLVPAVASAASVRTFVASTGTDSGRRTRRARQVPATQTGIGFGFGGGTLTATLDLSRASGNASGVYTTIDAQSKLYVSRSVVTGNTTGVKNVFGTVLTFRDNRIAGNGTDIFGTVTTATPQ